MRTVFPGVFILQAVVAVAISGECCRASDSEGFQIVSHYVADFTRPPRAVPTVGMPDGPLLGNGDVGVVLAGPPESQTFYVGKNDFWTNTPARAKVITVGRVEVNIPALQGASYHQEQDIARAEVRGTFIRGAFALRTRSWVDANTNLLLTELQNDGSEPIPVAVRSLRGAVAKVPRQGADNKGPVEVGHDAGEEAAGGFTRTAGTEPGSREVAVATRVLDTDSLEFTLKPRDTVTVATAILSDLDAKDVMPAAKKLVAELTPAKVAELRSQHRKWWANFWARSFIEMPDKEIEKRWYAALYVMGSCSRPGKVAPGLWGNWVTTDKPSWQGDFHLNYNFQAPYYIVYATNHADLSLPFYQALTEWLPQAREFAKKHGWKGAHYPVSIGPWGLCSYSPDLDLGQRSDGANAALNFIWYWQYTQDREWLRSTGYPFVREVADFWEDYLKFKDGRYVDENDAIHEGHYPTDINPILTLGLLRTLFTNIVSMSETLDIDVDKRAKWRDIVAKLSPFPTQQRGGRTVFRYTEKGLAWWKNNTLGIQHIFPAGAIGLGSDPKLLETSRNTIDEMHRWSDNNGFSSWYTTCVRVGVDPKLILAKMHAECDRHSMPNLVLKYGGGGIESCGGFLAVNEMLLQSYDGVIRLFPCWPANQNARFGNLRARGALLVSAELNGGTVKNVRITSEKGGDCKVINPWPRRSVQIVHSGQPAQIIAGDRVTFATHPGETFELQPLAAHSQ